MASMLSWITDAYHATASGFVKSTVPNVNSGVPLTRIYGWPEEFCDVD